MLSRGNEDGTSRSAFSSVVSLKRGIEMIFLFSLEAKKPKARIAMVKESTMGTRDSGFVYPKTGIVKFIISPNSITKDVLSPTERTAFSTQPSLLSLREPMMSQPGRKDMKTNESS